MITSAQLLRIMPLAGSRITAFVDPINLAMLRNGIDLSTNRTTMFLAEVAFETNQLSFLRELWGPTAAQLGYEGRADLGNTQPGDGFKFRGRGMLMTTGRYNYRQMGVWINLPLEETPEYLETPEPAALAAGAFWYYHGLNELADVGDFDRVSRRINGGTNGLNWRRVYLTRARAALT